MKKMNLLVTVLLFFLTALINAQTDPPAYLSYKHYPVTYVTCAPIVPDSAVVTGTPDSFTIVPALPAGLSLDKTTGTISGTPTVPTATANYTVTARNAAGSTTFVLAITVNTSLVPPTNLTYSTNPVTYAAGATIAPNTPTILGNSCMAFSYSVSPALPAGLTLNATTGVITGTPTTATGTASYTVTATNAAGSTTVSLSITVICAIEPPATLSYKYNPVVWVMGTAIIPDTVVTTGRVDSFTVTPALTAGLSLDKATGIISGTPTAATAATTYIVTANADNGPCSPSGTVAVSITIIDPSNVLPYQLKVRVFDAHYSNGVLRYALPDPCFVCVKYYDVKGRTVASFVNKIQPAGYYSLPLQSVSLPAGAYLQVFKAGSSERREIITMAR